MQYTSQKPVDPLILNVWPLADGQSSSYTLYEDGSDSESYKHGVFALTPISAAQHGDTLAVDIAPAQGAYPGMPITRGYELCLPADWPPESVILDGKALSFQPSDAITPGWSYDGNTLSTIVHIPSHSVSEAVHIELRRATGSMAARPLLDGFAGAIVRLHSAYDILNQQWSFIWSPDPLIEAWQTGDRLSYRPKTARDELSHFAQRYNSAQASVQQLLEPIENFPDDQLSRQLSKRDHNVAIEQAQLYKTALKRALAQLQDRNPN